MPLFPTLNDLKGMTISINPLNLFDPKPAPPSTDSPSSPASPTTPRVGEAGPGPSSLSNRTLNAVANGGSHLNGSTTPSPLGNGAQRPRGLVKQTSSDGSTSGGDARGRPGLQGRRASSQVMIKADEPRRREKKKKVPMDVSTSLYFSRVGWPGSVVVDEPDSICRTSGRCGTGRLSERCFMRSSRHRVDAAVHCRVTFSAQLKQLVIRHCQTPTHVFQKPTQSTNPTRLQSASRPARPRRLDSHPLPEHVFDRERTKQSRSKRPSDPVNANRRPAKRIAQLERGDGA